VVDSRNLCVIFAPLIGQFLDDWVSSLPESEVGGTTAAERDSHLARIDLERQSLVARRNALRGYPAQNMLRATKLCSL